MTPPTDTSVESTGAEPIDAAQILAHVEELAAAEEFAGSERRRDLLRYLVSETLAGANGSLKAYAIGRKALGRPPGFDPQTDPIVRVEIGRLRATLDRYYRRHPDAPLVVAIPKGRYTAEFTALEQPTPVAATAVVHIDRFTATTGRSAELSAAIVDALASFVVRVTDDPSSVTTGEAVEAEGVCVVKGSVRAVGDRVRVAVELFLPDGEGRIVARTFDEDVVDGDDFDLVDRIAERIGWLLLDDWGPLGQRDVRLAAHASPDHTRPARNAYYEAFRSVRPDDIVAAAVELDSVADKDARSLAELSDTLIVSWMLSAELDPAAPDRAEDLAVRAVALDPRLVEAHLALGYAHAAKRRSGLMEEEFEVALRLAPPSPNTLHCIGIMLAFDGSWERAETFSARAVDLNPDLPTYWHLVPCIAALHRGDFARAYVESLQIGETIGFVGSALRLAASFAKDLPLVEEAKQLTTLTPDPTVQPIAETVERVFHDDVVRDLVLQAVDASRVASA